MPVRKEIFNQKILGFTGGAKGDPIDNEGISDCAFLHRLPRSGYVTHTTQIKHFSLTPNTRRMIYGWHPPFQNGDILRFLQPIDCW